jgi:acyl-coenzyme A synthetase/AMP-(fatty) acid ligase
MGLASDTSPATFADFILLHAKTQPGKPAIILPDRVATFAMLAQGMLRVEERIRTLGLVPGDLVCVSLDNAIRHLIVAAALFRLGLPVISAGDAGDISRLRLPVRLFLHGMGQPMVPGLRQVLVDDGWFAGDDQPIAAHGPGGFADPEMMCRVVVSSGTTGRPKAVSLSLRPFNHKLDTCHLTLDHAAWDRLLCLPALESDFGFKYAAHVLRAGKTLLRADSARSALELISVYGVNALVASAHQLRDLVDEQKKSPIPCHSLRLIRSGGSLLTRELLQQVRTRLCDLVVNAFGSTEAGTVAIALADSVMEVDGAIGFIEPDVDVQVVDDQDRVLGFGVEGILRIRTPAQGRPFPPDHIDAQTGFRDGWFYPGDRCRIMPDGMLVLTGRASEVINSGGVKIAPDIIDDAVRKHESVLEGAAFGAIGASGIEEIYLAVKARTAIPEQDIIDWCAKRKIEIARVFFVEDLPKTSLGKIRRDELRQQLLS